MPLTSSAQRSQRVSTREKEMTATKIIPAFSVMPLLQRKIQRSWTSRFLLQVNSMMYTAVSHTDTTDHSRSRESTQDMVQRMETPLCKFGVKTSLTSEMTSGATSVPAQLRLTLSTRITFGAELPSLMLWIGQCLSLYPSTDNRTRFRNLITGTTTGHLSPKLFQTMVQ